MKSILEVRWWCDEEGCDNNAITPDIDEAPSGWVTVHGTFKDYDLCAEHRDS